MLTQHPAQATLTNYTVGEFSAKVRKDVLSKRTLPCQRRPTSVAEALARVHRHREAIVAVNVCKDKGALDAALRCALTTLATGAAVAPPPGTDAGLRCTLSQQHFLLEQRPQAGRSC